MDRKIEIDKLSENAFQELLLAVNVEILDIAKEAQERINTLLLRFNVKCDISLNYTSQDLPAVEAPIEVPAKKKRTRKKKS